MLNSLSVCFCSTLWSRYSTGLKRRGLQPRLVSSDCRLRALPRLSEEGLRSQPEKYVCRPWTRTPVGSNRLAKDAKNPRPDAAPTGKTVKGGVKLVVAEMCVEA